MMKAIDAANFLLFLADGTVEDMTNMKLNKLLYYAQGQCLKMRSERLFEEDVEAWDHGPVINDVYQNYKGNGDSPITVYDKDAIQRVGKSNQKLLADITRHYGFYTASQLRSMTHSAETPWSRCFKRGVKHIKISPEIIKDYFDKKEPAIKQFEYSPGEKEAVGYFDQDGYTVLPKEFENEWEY